MIRIKTLIDGWVEVLKKSVFDSHAADENAHHAKSHSHDGLDGSGTVAHADTTGKTTDDHHAIQHAHDGADGSGTVDHTALTSIGSNTHAVIDTHLASGANPHSTNYLNLADTDDSDYAGDARKGIRINDAETGLVFQLYSELYIQPTEPVAPNGSIWIEPDV